MPFSGNVAIRPLARADLDGFASWGGYADPLFRHYDARALTAAEADALFATLTAPFRRAYAGLADGAFVATLLLRGVDPAAGSAEVGIAIRPSHVGLGLGPRFLRALAAEAAAAGIERLRLEVMAWNRRALAAYRAAGFRVTGERWGPAEPGVDLAALLATPAAAALCPALRPLPGGGYEVRVAIMERRADT